MARKRPRKDPELRRLEAWAQSPEALKADEDRLRPQLTAEQDQHDEILRRSRESFGYWGAVRR